MDNLLVEIERRWDRMFSSLAAGADVPPALRLRTEGMMEALVLLQGGTAQGLTEVMEQRYQVAFGRSMEADLGIDWQAFFPFPQIPAMGRRAPVYPSTADLAT